ncbi:T9SS type A sorting domain-containing protein [Hymenobacter cheonanensis]|uniref:T9SS type A sorting domain-containing protein n=1 Tax=Hymenobacter sp. CA2-7 TaxID=3063993 RepID=UPI002712763E|nr:T9SS type A sorting domain-containing protein [Hymenobacter sp. CA2-7]MDO7884187.1 T9SS type A sorting domain-containing protein [Hymenobacter sp. CA2-7]
MRKLFTGLLSMLTLAASAQTGPGWASAAGLPITPSFNFAPSFAHDAAGNTYLASAFTQTVTLAPGTTVTSQGLQDGIVAKYGPTGNLLWYRQLGGTGNESFQKIIIDASGKLALLGLAGDGAQFGSTTFNTSNFSSSLVLAQLTDQGQVQYLREVGNASITIPASLASDAAGNYYLSGTFALSATFGTFELTTPITTTYGIDQFIVKVSAAGVVQWARQGGSVLAGTPTALTLNHLVAEPGGSVYFLWTFPPTAGGFGGLTLPAGKGDYDALVIKYDPQGTPLWAQRLGGAGVDIPMLAGLDSGGRLVVPGFAVPAGSLASPITAGSTTASTGFVSVLEPTAGAVVWSRDLQATLAGGYRSVAADAAGNIYLAGHFSGQATLPGKTLTGTGGIEALVASYSANGTLRWTQQSAGTGDELATSIGLDAAGKPVVAGLFNGNGLFGSTALVSPATTTTTGTPFVASLSGGTVMATRAAVAAAPLALYPNPAAAATAVSLPTLPSGTQLTLIDGLGRVARRTAASPSLPLAGLAPGLYVVQATAPSGEQWASRLTVE